MRALSCLFSSLLIACGGGSSSTSVDAPVSTVDATPSHVRTVACPATPDATVSVAGSTAADYHFVVNPPTIPVGGIVRFGVGAIHDVGGDATACTGCIDDPGLSVSYGETVCKQFTAAGSYGMMCSAHGFQGKIVVQ